MKKRLIQILVAFLAITVPQLSFSLQPKVTPATLEQFKDLPIDVQEQIIAQATIDAINKAASLSKAFQEIDSLRLVSTDYKKTIDRPGFATLLLPALINQLKKEPTLEDGLKKFERIVQTPLINKALENIKEELKKNTGKDYTIEQVLLSYQPVYDSFIDTFSYLTLEKPIVPNQDISIGFLSLASDTKGRNPAQQDPSMNALVKEYPVLEFLLNDKDYLNTLLSQKFIDKFNEAGSLEEKQQTLKQVLLKITALNYGLTQMAQNLLETKADINRTVLGLDIEPKFLLLAIGYTPEDREKITLYLQHGATLNKSDLRIRAATQAKKVIGEDGKYKLKQLFMEHANEETKEALFDE